MRISDWSSDVCSSDLREPMRLRENMKAAKEHRCMKATCGEMRVSARRSRCNGAPFTYTPVGRGKNKRYYRRIFMPDLPLFFRLARPARSLPLLVLFAFAGFAAPAPPTAAALPSPDRQRAVEGQGVSV